MQGFGTYNYQISDFAFIQVGFLIALIAPTLLLFLYPIARKKTKAWARRFANLCSALFVLGGLGTMVYAVASGEWRRFLAVMGFSTFFELFMLAFLYFLSMRFMASRTIAGLPDTAGTTGTPDPFEEG